MTSTASQIVLEHGADPLAIAEELAAERARTDRALKANAEKLAELDEWEAMRNEWRDKAFAHFVELERLRARDEAATAVARRWTSWAPEARKELSDRWPWFGLALDTLARAHEDGVRVMTSAEVAADPAYITHADHSTPDPQCAYCPSPEDGGQR